MASTVQKPVADWRNYGWGLVGVTNAFSALASVSDSMYVTAPASQGDVTVSFPVDITAVPAGAVVTSVTITARLSLGSGSAPAGTTPTITVATTAADNPSQQTVRDVPVTNASGSPATVTIATYQRDCLGFPWDIFRFNNILCRIFCKLGVADLIRCYELYCTVNYRTAPTVAVTGPTGTVLTASPTFTWTYSQTDGDPLDHSEYRLFTAVQQADVSFNPDTTPPVFDAVVSGDVTSVVLPTSINPDNYWVYVRSWSSFQAKSAWTGRAFTVSGPAPGVPGVPDPTGNSAPGVGVIQTVPDSFNGAASLTLGDTSNMLSVIDSSAEDGATDGTSLTGSNCAVTRDTSKSFPGGTASWKMTASSAANMSLLSDWTEIAPGQPVTARAQFLPAATPRSCLMSVQFYNASFALVSGTLTGSTVTTSTSTWTEAVVTGTVPSGAVYAQVSATVQSAANTEVHNLGRLGLMYGTSSPWSPGGHISRNLLSSWYASAQGSAGAGEAWTAGSANSVATGVAVTGTGASGTTCNSMTYAGLSPTLALRAAGTAFTSPTSGTNYTLTKPTGTATGDLMVARVSANTNCTITPPAGWTLVNSASGGGTSLFILKRTATAGDSGVTTWTDGVISASATRRHAVAIGYSGAADASVQFLADAAAWTGNTQPTFLTTPSVVNTDPNAWRLSAFAFNDDAASGVLTANIQQPSTIPAIAYVGAATPWQSQSGGTSFTINRPTGGVTTGDLMLATTAACGTVTFTAPAGWTIVRQAQVSTYYSYAVLKRTAGSSEPASWTGTLAGTLKYNPQVTQTLAYRNCADASLQFINEGSNTATSGNSLSTATEANTNSLAWRVCSFGADGTDPNYWSTNETSKRVDTSNVQTQTSQGWWWSQNTTNVDSITVAMADSNGSVGSGSYAKTGTMSESFDGAHAWEGILKPLGSPPAGVANETSRENTAVGSANPWMTSGFFDSNGVIPTGSTSVSGIFAPGDSDGAFTGGAAGWVGILKPASPVRSGYSTAVMATYVDLSKLDPSLIGRAGGQITATAAFLGSTTGTAYLTVNFYRANQLINAVIGPGSTFGTSVWSKAVATFTIPTGTTRVTLGVSAADRNVSDVVYWQRSSVALGGNGVYRPSTSRAAHPVFAVPWLQYADDDGSGYKTYADLPGQLSSPPSYDALSGIAVYTDHTVIPLINRKYHAKTISYGLLGDLFVSGYGPDSSEFSFTAQNWWLKDIANPRGNVLLKVKFQDTTISTTNVATVYQPLGRTTPVVLSEGFKTDFFNLELIPVNHADWVNLGKLLNGGRTLFLQSDVDQGWWVRPTSNIDATVLATNMRQSNPLRTIKVSMIQVDPVS